MDIIRSFTMRLNFLLSITLITFSLVLPLGETSAQVRLGLRHGHGHARRTLATAPSSHPDFPLVLMTKEKKGEYTLDVEKTHDKLEQIFKEHPDQMKITFLGKAEGERFYKINISSPAIAESISVPRPKIAITAGVHGNEPMGVVALVNVIEEILKMKDLTDKFDFVIYPMINPHGLKMCRRNSKYCKDLNRSFRKKTWSSISKMIGQSIQQEGAIKVAMDLHGSGRKGIFVIKLEQDDHCLVQQALAAIPQEDLQPSEQGIYPGPCKGGSYTMLAPGEAMSKNEGTLKEFFGELGVPYCYTFEYPRPQPLEKQIGLMTDLVMSYLNNAKEKLQ